MKLTIHTIGGGKLDVADFDQVSLMDMIDRWGTGGPVLAIALNDGMAYIPKTAVARIDTRYDDTPPEAALTESRTPDDR